LGLIVNQGATATQKDCCRESMIPKSGNRFSEKIMLKQKVERDDDSKKNHPARVA
jgi:hypothetical protein